MNWMIACKQAAALMVAREDRALVLRERAALRVHLLVCKACTRFEGQMLTMRHAMDSWRSYREAEPTGEPDEAGGATANSPKNKPHNL